MANQDPTNGRFIAGNKAWKARSSAGPNPKFETAEDLWEACVEYFEWVDSNPLWEDRLVTFQGSASHEPVGKMRAMTIVGLCLFLDIGTATWFSWRKSRPDLLDIMTRVENVIYQQKFSGAAADLLNANIIARDLGLADKSEVTGKDGGPIETKDGSDLETARRIAFMLGRAVGRHDKKSDVPTG